MDYYERKFRASGSVIKVCWYALLGCILIILIMAIASMFSSCRTITKTEVIEKVRIDTLKETKWQKDSVWMHDSVLFKENGDTVLIEKWHTQWRVRLRIDTVYHVKVDSIPAPYPVEKLVEKDLSWWQKTQMYAGDMMLMFIIAAIIYGLYRAKKAFLP